MDQKRNVESSGQDTKETTNRGTNRPHPVESTDDWPTVEALETKSLHILRNIND